VKLIKSRIYLYTIQSPRRKQNIKTALEDEVHTSQNPYMNQQHWFHLIYSKCS